LLVHSPKRIYALCTGIPFVFVLVTTVVAAVGKIQEWWDKIATAPPDQVFLLRLVCGLAAIMLVLTAIIAGDTFRRWYLIFRGPAVQIPPALVGVAAGTTTHRAP
jgi:carbon starvation protein CstA